MSLREREAVVTSREGIVIGAGVMEQNNVRAGFSWFLFAFRSLLLAA